MAIRQSLGAFWSLTANSKARRLLPGALTCTGLDCPQPLTFKEEQHLKTLSIALMAAFMLVLAATSTGQAQSAEDLVKGQNPGVKYVYRGDGVAEVIYIRGDELTEIIEIPGNPPERLTFPILARRQEGNKLILDYQWPLGGDTYEATIIGDTLTNRKTKGILAGREEVFTGE